MVKNVVDLYVKDNNRSSVEEELNAMNFNLNQIMISLEKISRYNEIVNDYEIDLIRRNVKIARQRSYRAEQCSRGLTVFKAT